MKSVYTQDTFIEQAKIVHHNRYDYSLVQYVNTQKKVQIICPEHGVFDKAPGKHLQGQGCPVCGRNRTKMGIDDFIFKAQAVHGDKYDYSNVVYSRTDSPVEIVCPIHGSFMQTPHNHITLRHGCPKCGNESAGLKRMGINNVAHRIDVKAAKAATCENRYGASTWAASDEGRKRLHEIIVDEGKLDKMKQTCQERYGTDFWTQSAEGKAALHERMSSEEIRAKIVAGYKTAYGMHYMQTEDGRARAKHYIDDERREKMLASMMKRYGVPYAYLCPDIVKKNWQTRRRNGTFNTSKPEKTLYLLLCDVFGADDVVVQYVDDERYPFHCDFYVKSLDLFIELNAHWSHGGHWFDETSSDDIVLLNKWMSKTKEKGSAYYHQAIMVWTERDLLKRQFAIANDLNYVVFWKQDLSDAREYLSSRVVRSETVK